MAARLRNDPKMKKLNLTAITLFLILTVFGQNGLKSGDFFLLQKDRNTISINTFENNRIIELNSFPISDKSIYTTDQKSRVAILDTAKNHVTIFNLKTSDELTLTVPYDIKPKSLLLNEDNLFIGGEFDQEMLVQYHIKSEKWFTLEIPIQVLSIGKAIDDLVISDTLLVAIDNIITPKYVLFYRLNSNSKSELSHFKELKYNGAYERIHQGRITEKYFGLVSDTFSGWVGRTNHITIYENFDLTSSFALSSNQSDKDYHTFTDFLIIKDKVIIASEEMGLGIFSIKNSYFKKSDEFGNETRNAKVSTSKIKYDDYETITIIKLTPIPNSENVVLSLLDEKGAISHKILEI